MSSTDFHLRQLVQGASQQRSHDILDAAFAVIEGNFDRFGSDFSSELLVLYAEAASDLRNREATVLRTLELYDRLRCEDDQFKVRALLIRCVYEARLGSQTHQLKGQHLLQQLQYALKFLMQALSIATRKGLDERYGFLVYNASLVFWSVIRPLCRLGWQQHLVTHIQTVLDFLKPLGGGAGGGKGGGKGGGGGLMIPVAVDPTWIVDMTLNLAFGYEDAGKDPDATKTAEAAYALLDEMLKAQPEREAKDPQLRMLVLNARAHFVRKQAPGAQGAVRTEVEKIRGSAVAGAAFFVRNGGIPKEGAEDELIKVWGTVDTDYNLVEAREALNGKLHTEKKEREKGGDARGNALKPPKLADLACALRAACAAECWAIARPMAARLEKFQVPAGRARIMTDLSKAEIDVWVACNVKMEDPNTKMLLTAKQQSNREVEARCRAVRLCEQCIMAAKRVNDVECVEDSAITMWNVAKELMCDEHRVRIHKSLQKCVDLLDEAQSMRLVQLRAQLHFEVACCEIAQDLLTKGRQELLQAQAIDYTIDDNVLPDAIKAHLAVNDEVGEDPAPFIRRFDAAIGEQSHLLNWKLSLYEDPEDPTDQVVLLLDQVRQQGAAAQAGGNRSEAAKKLTTDLLSKGYAMLETVLEELTTENPDGTRAFESMNRKFNPPARVIDSENPLKPLPNQAPATVKDVEMLADGKGGPPIQDLRTKSEYESAVARIKTIVMLMCKISREAFRVGQIEFAIKVANRALGVQGVDFGPPPIEVEGALLLSEAAYTKALCLNTHLEELAVVNGLDDEIEGEKPEDEDEKDEEGEDEEEPELTPEEKAEAVAKKREMIAALLLGMERSHKFKQHWMVANGMAHWWNLHLELVELSFHKPDLLKQTLSEYRDGLATMMKYLAGEAAVQDSDFDQKLAANLALAHVNVNVAVGNLGALEMDQLMVLKRLSGNERKDLVARVTELCKKKEKPFKIEDLAKVRPERLDAAAPAAAAPAAKKAPAPAKDSPPPGDEDKSDLLGREVEVVSLLANVEGAKDHDEALKFIEQAVGILNTWDPPQNNEDQLTLWVELWTRVGRRCVGKPLNPNVGCKYALMCSIKGLGNVQAPIPPHASSERMRWRGACHALCGQAFANLVDPKRQEKESLLQLRQQSVEQYERCCEYARATANKELAIFGAKSLWNVALSLLHSAETRQRLIDPLLMATRALAKVKYDEDPYFYVGLYASLFDCYSDSGQWGKINEMLSEAFPAVPAVCHRRLWSLRMLALSRQGKNVVVAMGMMKESQPKAQAQIWLVLARASSKRTDQLDAYLNAIKLLQDAQQSDVVEVRLELADWLLRNGSDHSSARDQLAAAADVLLEIEEDPDEEEYPEELGDDDGDGVESSHVSELGDDNRSLRSMRSSRRGGSEAGSMTGRRIRKSRSSKLSSRGSQRGSHASADAKKRRLSRASSTVSRSSGKSSSSRSKARKAEQDQTLADQLYSHHYEALTRIYATSGRLATGTEMHSAFLAASHFAVRFFACTVDMANRATQELAVWGPLAGKKEDRTGSKRKSVSADAISRKKSIHIEDKPKENEIDLIPPFAVPTCLADWALEKHWPWRNSPALTEVLNSAAREGILGGETSTYAGHADVFVKPPLTFHMLTSLENDLQEHGYHLWALPILALHLQLTDAFTDNSAVHDAVLCFVSMRLSRFSSECKLSQAAALALEKCSEVLKEITQTFNNFGDELEQVQSQRSGRGLSDTLDNDRIEVAGGGKSVSAPWSCSDLHAYEVWAELSNECWLHGDLWMACTLADEAMKHAQIYGDRRTLRKVQIIKARLARDEGKYEEAVRTLRGVSASDVRQLVEIAIILADAYRARRRPVLADEVLNGALKAVRESAKVATGAGHSTSGHVFAECEVRAAQQFAEIARLELMNISQEWLQTLDGAFSVFNNIREELHNNALYCRAILTYLDFAEAAIKLLDGKFSELNQKAALSVVNGGPLSCQILANYAGVICNGMTEVRHSQQALLQLAVPVEGVDARALSPPQVLAARVDVWEARAISTRRTFLAVARVEHERHKKAALSTQNARTSLVSGESLPGRPSRVFAFEEETHDQYIRKKVQEWNEETDVNIEAGQRKQNSARDLGEVERSLGIVSNALSMLQSVSDASADAAGSPGGADSNITHPSSEVEAMVELGRLQYELAAEMKPEGATSKWERPPEDPGQFELQRMEIGERYSLVLQSKDPAQIFKVPEDDEGTPDEAVESGDASPDESPTKDIPYEEMGRTALCKGLSAALAARCFSSAQRALHMLAFDAYGVHCPEATFEFLAWLQSVNVILRVQDVFAELAPDDHPELVQLRLLHRLEKQSFDPVGLRAYKSTLQRLQSESPLFQRFMISDLPPVSQILLSYLPPLTMVVTLQARGDFVYVGACCSPPEGEHEQRFAQLKHFVTRVPIVEAELHTYVSTLQDLNQTIEKELMTTPQIDPHLEEQFEWILHRIDTWLLEPLVEELAEFFWPYSTHIEHPGNPQRVMLLPDNVLWELPLERCACWAQIFGRNSRSAVSRDLSLHAAAMRVRHIVDPAEGEKKPVKGNIPVCKLDKTALLTDPFIEDTLRKEENPNSETMCMLHQRLVNAKILGGATKTCEGQQFTSSPLDIKCMLTDSTGFFSLGFSRFYVTMPAQHFTSQDLRRLAVLGLFNKCINGQSFRRQTKVDSMKTAKQMMAENAYAIALIAAFRGVQSTVMVSSPVPTALALRSFEVFVRSLQSGKNLAKALEDVTGQQIKDPSFRYMRALEGGELPPEARGPTVEPVDPKAKGAGKGDPGRDGADSRLSDDPEHHENDLLPMHTQAAYTIVGPSWLIEEGAEGGGGGGGKKK